MPGSLTPVLTEITFFGASVSAPVTGTLIRLENFYEAPVAGQDYHACLLLLQSVVLRIEWYY